jgi:hypothetical protein
MGSGPLKRNLILANFTDPNSLASLVTRQTTAAGSGGLSFTACDGVASARPSRSHAARNSAASARLTGFVRFVDGT